MVTQSPDSHVIKISSGKGEECGGTVVIKSQLHDRSRGLILHKLSHCPLVLRFTRVPSQPAESQEPL